MSYNRIYTDSGLEWWFMYEGSKWLEMFFTQRVHSNMDEYKVIIQRQTKLYTNNIFKVNNFFHCEINLFITAATIMDVPISLEINTLNLQQSDG